jgi:nucleoid DNA-binding protein/outer membrane biosynthesis protein TonB
MKMNERLSTRSLVDLLAIQTGMEKERAEKFIDILSAYIAQGIENNKSVRVMGLGVFKIVLVRERESVHIQTGERFVIPAHHKLSFIPDKDLKDQINRQFSFFGPIETTEDLPFTDNRIPDTKTEKEPEIPVVILDDDITEDLSEEATSGKIPEERPVQEETADDYFIAETDEEDEAYHLKEEDEGTDPVGSETVNLSDDQLDNIQYEYKEVDAYPEDDDPENMFQFQTGEQRRDENEDADDYALQEAGNYNNSLNGKAKKKTSYFWVLCFLLLSFLFVAGVIIGTYAFLYYNSDKSNEDAVSFVSDNQAADPTLDNPETAPLPIGEIRVTDTDTGEKESDDIDNPYNDMESMPIGSENTTQASTDRAENEQPAAETKNTAKEKREGKPVIDWLAPLPENSTKQETKRVDKPNRAIEEKNKSLPTPKQNQPKSNNKTASTTNQPKNAPAEKALPPRVRMTSGSSLTQIALEHYGDKVFWVYIYDYNKSRIKDFNNIPVGMEIRLPQPKLYGINAKSRTSVQKARQKQSELLKWDKWDDYQ